MGDQNQTNGAAAGAANAFAAATDLPLPRQQRFRQTTPRHLQYSAGKSSCCIFTVPRSLSGFKPKDNEPRIASIGPYHHADEHVQMIEEHKPRYLSNLEARTRCYGVSIDDYFNELSSRENQIRDCYSQPLQISNLELIEMMVLDGCFIMEVFRTVEGVIDRNSDEPLLNMKWVFPFLTRDFLLLENQIPFFVLETLYNLSRPRDKPQPSLISLALKFFNWTIDRPSEELVNFEQDNIASNIKHLLHLLQLLFTYSLTINPLNDAENRDNNRTLIQSAQKLDHAGIKFELAKRSESLLKIKFVEGVLQIPRLSMDDFMACFLQNCIAFELCYCYTKDHITTYVQFMGCLMRTETDSSFLSDCQILENYCGSYAEVASFFNDIVKDIAFDVDGCYLAGVFHGVETYYKKWWRVQWAGIMRECFRATWSRISACAAFTALALTVIQTFMVLYEHFHSKKKN